MKALPKKRTLIIHPYILAIYPILFFFNLNRHDLWFSEILLPLAVSLVATQLLFTILKIALSVTVKAAILTSLILILFFSYEAILTGIAGNGIGDLVLSIDPNLFWSYGILLALATIGLRFWKVQNNRITEYLNLVSVILILFPLFGLVNHQISTQGIKIFPQIQSGAAIPEDFKYSGPKPDIYYIILDGYMRDDVLKESWGYDNQEFIRFLKNKGFFIASKSRSNYPVTVLSLPSSLNFNYLQQDKTIDVSDHKSLLNKIDDNRVVRFLKGIGYTYIHLSDEAAETKFSRHADLRISYRKWLTPFSEYLINKSLLKGVNLKAFDPLNNKRERILYGFEKLKEVPKIKSPKFTFAHFVAPHEPYVFNKYGESPSKDIYNEPSKYFEQALYINKLTMEVVEKILSTSDSEPIIIIQGDHGTSFLRSTLPRAKQIKEQYSILNAYFFPGEAKSNLYENVSPVNSFRIIFNNYFGTDFPILKDESFLPLYYSQKRKLVPIPKEASLEKNDSQAWIHLLNGIVSKKPEFAEAHAFLGWNYIRSKQYSKAENSLNRALKINPQMDLVNLDLLNLYAIRGDHKAVFNFSQQFSETSPYLAEVYRIKGDFFANSNQYDKALEAFQKVITINPKYVGAYHQLGLLYLKMRDFDQSIYYFKETVKLLPTFYYYNDLGNAYASFNYLDEGIKEIKKALAIKPNFAEAHYNLGHIHIKKKKYKQGINYYKKAIEHRPDYFKAYFNLGVTYNFLNKPLKAIEYYQQALKLNPDHIPIYISLGNIQLFHLGQVEQARKTYEVAILKQPKNAEIHRNLGIIYSQKNKNPDKAIFHFQESIRLAPEQLGVAKIYSAIQALIGQS